MTSPSRNLLPFDQALSPISNAFYPAPLTPSTLLSIMRSFPSPPSSVTVDAPSQTSVTVNAPSKTNHKYLGVYLHYNKWRGVVKKLPGKKQWKGPARQTPREAAIDRDAYIKEHAHEWTKTPTLDPKIQGVWNHADL